MNSVVAHVLVWMIALASSPPTPAPTSSVQTGYPANYPVSTPVYICNAAMPSPPADGTVCVFGDYTGDNWTHLDGPLFVYDAKQDLWIANLECPLRGMYGFAYYDHTRRAFASCVAPHSK